MGMYTLNLLGRNIRNTVLPRDPEVLEDFKNSSANIVIYYAVVLSTGIVTLPVIKTFVDMVSRKFVAKQAISNLCEELSHINAIEFNNSVDLLLTKAEKTPPKSISSAKFINGLKQARSGNPLIEWTNPEEKENNMRDQQKSLIREYMQAPHNNGKATMHLILESFETPAKEFIPRVKRVISRLENTFFGKWKAKDVRDALNVYERTPTPKNKQFVKNTLALQRMISSSPTQSEKDVGDWSMTYIP